MSADLSLPVAVATVPWVALEAVVFDWGGTLSVWADVDLTDMWALAARHLAPEREEELTRLLLSVEEAYWAETAGECRSGTLAGLLAQASATLGIDVAEAVLEEAATRHLDAWTPHIRHHADAAPTLRVLRRMGLAIGLLSNTHWPRAFHERFLERDGLDELIDVRLYTSEMEHMKPHPSVFSAALADLGVSDASRAVFVGDRLLDDVAGASRAGLRTVWVENTATPRFEVQPDASITSLSQLPDLVSAWQGA